MIRLQRMWPDYLANSSILLRLKNMCLSFFLQRPKFPPRNSYKQARTDPHRKNGSNPFFKDLLKHRNALSSASPHRKVPFPISVFSSSLKFWRERCTSHWNELRANLFWERITKIKANPNHKEVQ